MILEYGRLRPDDFRPASLPLYGPPKPGRFSVELGFLQRINRVPHKALEFHNMSLSFRHLPNQCPGRCQRQ